MLNAETKRHIDAARDVLVGVSPNPMTQIDQITYALIYKFMDDMDQSAIRAGGEPSFFTGELEPYAWSKLVDSRMGNQEKMNLYGEALQKFSEAKQLPELFRTIFRSALLPYRQPETLGLFLKEISYFDYTHPEDLGNAYEYLLSIMSSQGELGQFRTPRHIIDFIVEIVAPKKDERILDPACGTGGFLVSAYNHILEQHDRKGVNSKNEAPLTPNERKTLMGNLEGLDADPMMVRFAQVNMFLHQFKNPKIYQYDSLTNDEKWSEKYDVILANPPFTTPKGGIKPHSKFASTSSRTEVLFADYIVSHLKPNGRAGVIVYEPVLYQESVAHTALRSNMMQSGLVAVLSLPRGIFEPYSGVKTSILFFDQALAKERSNVLFAKISNDGFELSTTRKAVGMSDLPIALSEIKGWMKGLKGNLTLGKEIPRTQVLEDEQVTLIAERFLAEDRTQHDNHVLIGDLLSPVSKVPRVGSENIPIMSITMARGLIDQSEKFNKRIASADISNYKKVMRNQLVIGFPIDEGVLGFQQKYDAAAVSPAYEIWQIKDESKANTRFLELYLRSLKMREVYKSQMQSSVSRRRSVPKALFMKIALDLPSLEEQNRIMGEIEALEAEANLAMDSARNLMQSAGLV